MVVYFALCVRHHYVKLLYITKIRNQDINQNCAIDNTMFFYHRYQQKLPEKLQNGS